MTFQGVTFSGEDLYHNECKGDWCTHCHVEDNLKTEGTSVYSATGVELSVASRASVYTSKLRYNEKCKNYLKTYFTDNYKFNYNGYASTSTEALLTLKM
mmetsp:Transcript_8139/g.16022  ORF Transcript_8139/g.16022 Transcript_8139/m.16022 type:complete len:99 (-) Transcript_8139:4276-4572(-)